MGVEGQRKKLMANGPTWGDRLAHVAGGPCEGPDLDDNICNCDVEALTPIVLMNNVTPPPPPATHILTRGWTFNNILKKGKRFREVPRVALKEATKAVVKFDRDGVPLIIESLHEEPNWPKEDFHPDWLKNYGPKEISARNIYDRTDKTMLFDQFIEQCRSASTFASPEEQERLYGKDAECPEKWAQWLRNSKVVPLSLIPDNAEDLLSSRHVETLMCYIGVGDTFTPCHKDLCASSGQNLMCYTEMDGSSFWFMTKGGDAPEVSKYFHELEQELDHETHVITIEQLANAPFDVYIAEQKLGDLVLVPPRSCHQVVNFGGITIKTSWSRMTLKGLEIAYHHELPIYRRVCRPEIYQVKATIYQTLIKRKNLMLSSRNHKSSQAVLAPMIGDQKLISTTESLLKLFDSVLLEESSTPHRRIHCLQPTAPMIAPTTSLASTIIDQLTCDFCGADIFQSFFECLRCVNGLQGLNSSQAKHGDGFVICTGCYIEGRSCKCGNMDPIQCRPFQELLAVRNKVAELVSASKPYPIPVLEDNAPAFASGLFRVACKLQETRKNLKGGERICSTIVAGSGHAVPCSWVLNCKKCHRSRCFTHILMSQKLHAADAFFIHASDLSHEEHHRNHRNSLQKYEEGKDEFFRTQRMGSKPDLKQQRVHLAEQYHTCKPINSTFTQAGWYDVHVQLAPVIIETKDKSKDGSQNSSISGLASPLSPLTEIDSPLPLVDIMAPIIRPSAMFPSLKRKRTVLDFVAVPDKRYNVRESGRMSLTFSGPEPSLSQEIDPDCQSVNGDLLTSSRVANNLVCERDQEVVQTDPLPSLPNNRCNKTSHTRASTSQTPLNSSCPEISSKDSTPFFSDENESKKHNSKKHQTLSSSPTAPMSFSTHSATRSASSTPTRSSEARKRPQTRDNTFTDESKKSRLHGPSPSLIIPDQSSGLATSIEESQRKQTIVRRLPRFKKNSRPMRQVSEVSSSSSSSSTYPRSTPSDGPDLTQVLDSVVNEKHSALAALNINPATQQIPSINNNLPQAAQTAPTDRDALNNAVEVLAAAARTFAQSQRLPPQGPEFIPAATPLGQFTSHHSQSTIQPPTPGWFQEKCFPLFQPYPLSPPTRKWSKSGYQQSSQCHHGRFYGRLEGGPRALINYDHPSYHEDGATIRSGPTYSNRRHDSYQEDHIRRLDNRSHSYRPLRRVAQARERPQRSAMRFENIDRRPHNRSSYSQTKFGERGVPEYSRPTEFSPRAGLVGVKSSTSVLQGRGANDEANSGQNHIDGACPSEQTSPWHLPPVLSSSPVESPTERVWERPSSSQVPPVLSSSPVESPTDRVWERPSSSQVQQSRESSPHVMTSPPANSENGNFVERHSSPIDSENWEDSYEQEDTVIEREISWIEPSKPQQNEFSSPVAPLYDNPWAN